MNENQTKHISKYKISTIMAFISSALIGTIVLLISAYVIVFLRDISASMSVQTKNINKAVATSLVQILGPEVDKKDYAVMDKSVSNAINTNLIAYFIVSNNKTKKIEYSSIKELENVEISNDTLKKIVAKDTNNFFMHGETSTYYIVAPKKNSTIYVGFFTKAPLTQSLEVFTDNMSYMVILSIMLGLILSHIFIRIITNPLNNLLEGSKKFASGDFNHRIAYFNYQEIDDLVDAYNTMAENLRDMYVSLENKVAERTKQLNKAYNELKNTQAMMVHSEKMKSLGELVAGITHEINNPVNFIYGNLIHLTNYTNDLISLIDKYGEYESDLLDEHRKEIEQIKNDIDLAFLKEDLGALINSCKEGTERTKNIIMDLKNFSRMEERVISSINIAKEIDTTLNILHSKYKNRIEIHKDYDENLPLVESYGGQLNQVFMNILDNAFYAIEGKGDVYISTKHSGENVIIEFKDTGKGMDRSTAEKIFDPFFTTKPVGQGTGLGMSISYRVIKDHNGDIKIKTEPGKGTTFVITLPIVFKQDKESVENDKQV